MGAVKDPSSVKIAVKMENKNALLIEFDQIRPLDAWIQQFLNNWGIEGPSSDYSLQFVDRENYVTEKNRSEIRNGTILNLVPSASKTASTILERIEKASTDEKRTILSSLVKLCSDVAFVEEFIAKEGKEYLVKAIEHGTIRPEEGLGLALEAFVELMNHGLCSWDSLEPKFVAVIANNVNSEKSYDPKILINSLAILENLLMSGSAFNSIVEAEVTLPNLMKHVKQNMEYPLIQQNTIALINALLLRSDLSKKKAIAATLSSKQMRKIILENIINVSRTDDNGSTIVSSSMGSTSAIGSLSGGGLGGTSLISTASNNTTAGTGTGVTSSMLSSSSSVQVGSEMAHQLYILQTSLINLHEERMQAKPTTSVILESEAREKLVELMKLAFESDQGLNMDISSRVGVGSSGSVNSGGSGGSSGTRSIISSSTFKSNSAKNDYIRLGFTNYKNPIEDFNETPPGILALDLMSYFARNHTEKYRNVVLENCMRSDREHECPFAKSAIQVTKLIAELFKIGEAPSDEGKLFYPMFFNADHPVEEFFCICVPLLNKTWKEMKATSEDFAKVFSVLRQQLLRALSDQEAISSFAKFEAKTSSLTYSTIMNLWQKERSSREEWENKAQAILELREKLKPEIVELIKQQRLQYLTEGTQFVKYSNKGQRIKDKFWYCRLSNKFKVLYYGDCDENKIPSIDELPHKLAINDIKEMLIGKECAHMKDAKSSKKSTFALAFSLTSESFQGEPLNFVAPSEKVFDYWTDGINALLGNEMISKEAQNDLETLLSMEIKLRLLDTEGVTIPEVPPKIPDPPSNYDFALVH
ncbi:engulfment and cell motility protein 1 [Tetranychus urticae]|uniref:engulfment and cell motility protein 1 n=1 Tax=Tetranychus urticae TaxID=32264 RepID=UPI00077BD564|nr:engulfment and cell motility protein 1 [Tetranychus urticae]